MLEFKLNHITNDDFLNYHSDVGAITCTFCMSGSILCSELFMLPIFLCFNYGVLNNTCIARASLLVLKDLNCSSDPNQRLRFDQWCTMMCFEKTKAQPPPRVWSPRRHLLPIASRTAPNLHNRRPRTRRCRSPPTTASLHPPPTGKETVEIKRSEAATKT